MAAAPLRESTVDMWEGIRSISKVCNACIQHGALADWRWALPALMALSAAASEWVSTYIMTLISGFYFAISSEDTHSFYTLLIKAVFVVSVLSILVAARKFAVDACALQWREDLVLLLHSLYFRPGAAYGLAHSAGGVPGEGGAGGGGHRGSRTIDNPDQRIQQDADKFTTTLSTNLSTLLPIPAVLLFYTWHLWHVFGWIAPTGCYVYFAISTYVCSSFTKVLIPIVCEQDRREGDFRFRLSRLRAHAEAVSMLRGEAAEGRRANRSLAEVCDNMRLLVLRRVPLNFWVTWFSYIGSIVNYGVIGITILVVLHKKHLSAAQAAALLSSGSYACLYLIGTFSTLLSMSQEFSQLCGYSARLLELMEHESLSEKSAPWVCYNNVEDGENDGCSDAVDAWTGSAYSRWAKHLKYAPMLQKRPPAYDRLPSTSEDAMESGPSRAGSEVELAAPRTQARAQARPPARASPCSPPPVVLSIRHLSIAAPGGGYLVRDLCLDVRAGSRLLITGASGQGKTCLFRVLAGLLRPDAISGGASDCCVVRFHCAPSDVLFLPQDPYFAEGTIAENVCYPRAGSGSAVEGATASIMEAVSAGGDWRTGEMVTGFGEALSPGEHQRVNIARALFTQPLVLFLDEATSALDENAEVALMKSVAECCETVISIGHRSSLQACHNLKLHIDTDGSWEMSRIPLRDRHQTSLSGSVSAVAAESEIACQHSMFETTLLDDEAKHIK